jgi:hypothetical protein
MFTTFNTDMNYLVTCHRLGIRPNPRDYEEYLISIEAEIDDFDEDWDFD